MRKKGLRRFQLFLLAVVVGLIIWRMTSSAESGTGVIVISDLSEGRLYSKHFEVFSLAPVVLTGVASFEDDDASAQLAVYPWIVNRGSDEVVWMPTKSTVTRDGVKALIADSLQLEPGMYSLYYTTLGPSRESRRGGSFMGLKPHWTNYESFWNVSIAAAPEMVNPVSRVDGERNENSIVWEFRPTKRGRGKSRIVHVAQEASLHLEVVASICNARCDDVIISRLPDGEPLWSMTTGNSEAIGGSSTNRKSEADISLTPGVYEISFEAGSIQALSDWSENPPHLPYYWGIMVSSEQSDAIRQFDPWNMSEPLVEMLKVGDSELIVSKLETDNPLDVIVYGMGEMTSSSDLYDWGWIEREEDSGRVWEMSYRESSHAGGDASNRKQMAMLRLDPGTYYVKYKTDDSHSYQRFGKRRPDNSERWGIVLFPLDSSSIEEGSVRVEQIQVADIRVNSSTNAPSPLEGVSDEQFLIRWTSLGNDERISEEFELEEETTLIVAALGEISSEERFDWGRIESIDADETIWEMTYANTTGAGGDDSYRRIVSELTLPAGTYRVSFETDQGVAFGSSLSSGLSHPEDWGIAIFRPGE